MSGDRVVYQYLNALVDPSRSEYVDKEEKETGLKLMANVLVAHDQDRNVSAVVERGLTNDKKKEESLGYDA
ncbi:hypothetical protein D3C78_1662240 [compost metagenome]